MISIHPSFNQSIHPSIFFGLFQIALRQQRLREPDFSHPSHLGQLHREGKNIVPQHILSLPLGLLQVVGALNTYPGRHPGGIISRCPGHLNWFLLMWRSSRSNLSPSRITQLLTLSPMQIYQTPFGGTSFQQLVSLIGVSPPTVQDHR